MWLFRREQGQFSQAVLPLCSGDATFHQRGMRFRGKAVAVTQLPSLSWWNAMGNIYVQKNSVQGRKPSRIQINISFNIFGDCISLFFKKKEKVVLPEKFLLTQMATYLTLCSSDFCTSHLQGRMLQLLSNFIPVGFPQIACPVFWESAAPYVITNIIIYIQEELKSIRALQLMFLWT